MSDSDPPPLPSVDRTMSVIGVIGWTALVVFLFLFAISMSASVRPGLSGDLVNNQLCFSLAFALTTWLMSRMHLPTREPLDAIGARRTPWWALGLGLVVGLALQLPALWLDGFLEQRWPLSAEAHARHAEMFRFPTVGHKVMFAVAAMGLGPISEELFCRGVLFRALRRSFSPWATVVLTTASFAALHLDARYAANAAMCGVALGLLRLYSGTIAVSLLGHVAFNAVSAVALMAGLVKVGEPDPPFSPALGAAGAAAVVAGLALLARLSKGSAAVAEAVEADAD